LSFWIVNFHLVCLFLVLLYYPLCATVVKADKSKAIVIINTDILDKKIDTFIKDNNIKQIIKDPTEKYQKVIQQTLQKCNFLVEKQNQKYLMNIKPMAPKHMY